MSLLDDIYGGDNRTIVGIANDIATPNRVARSWVKPLSLSEGFLL